LTGFSLQRTEDELFADKHEMLNVFQIYHALDSVKNNGRKINKNFLKSLKNDHPYFQSLAYRRSAKNNDPALQNLQIKELPKEAILYDSLSSRQKTKAVSLAQAKLRRKNQNLESQIAFFKAQDKDMNAYWIEFHRKFALTATIVVLFFIGAPLGAIVRKGGFGAPVVIAALLFMIYFVLISIGESLANSEVVSPFLGMWFATMVLTPVALVLLRAAANDSPVLNLENWSFLKKKRIARNGNSSSDQ